MGSWCYKKPVGFEPEERRWLFTMDFDDEGRYLND